MRFERRPIETTYNGPKTPFFSPQKRGYVSGKMEVASVISLDLKPLVYRREYMHIRTHP